MNGSSAAPGRQVRAVAVRFAEVVCPPEVRSHGRTGRVLDELGLLMGALPPGARHGLAAGFLALDRGARVYPRSRGRRFARLDDRVADAYLRALLARTDGLGNAARKLRSLVLMCYYELPDVQEEQGYRPGPYIAAVSRRRLASYGAEIRRGEAAVLAPDPAGPGAAGPGVAGPGPDGPASAGADGPGAP
jgi:hypothetical protein